VVRARKTTRASQRGALTTEMVVAMSILLIAVVPLALSLTHERQLLRRSYVKAVAMEIVDGETEVLAAGEWRRFQPGTQPYTVNTLAAARLPAGRFELNITSNRVRLDWIPQVDHAGGRVTREAFGK
jgi:hypothetical protein